MGFKAIKERFQIKHIVHVVGDCICIGSPFVPNIITITAEGKVLKSFHDDLIYGNPDIRRYMADLTRAQDTGELKQLFHQKDTFVRKLIVYTVHGSRITSKFCESYSFPNTTIDGELMYDHTFFITYQAARRYMKKHTRANLKGSARAFVQGGMSNLRQFLSSCWRLCNHFYEYAKARLLY